MEVYSSFTCKRFPTRIHTYKLPSQVLTCLLRVLLLLKTLAHLVQGTGQSSFTGPKVVCEPCGVMELPATFFTGIRLKNILKMHFDNSVYDILYYLSKLFLCKTL